MKHIVSTILSQLQNEGNKELLRYKNKNDNKYKPISRQQFFQQVESLANALLAEKMGFEDKIGIFSFNRPEWTIADAGILTVRGIVVPLYATASKEQLKYIVDETKMKLLFAGSQQLDHASWLLDNCNSLEKVVSFDDVEKQDQNRLKNWNDFLHEGKKYADKKTLSEILQSAQETDTATIIYTSGTTGEPKGAILGHDNIVQAFHIHDIRMDITQDDISMCFLPLSHVFERTWTYYMLYKGVVNVYLENPKQVVDELTVVKPTVMCVVPRFFEKTYDAITTETQKWSSLKKKIFNWSIKIGHRYIEYEKDALKAPAGLRLKRNIADKLVLKKLRNIFGGNFRVLPCAGAAMGSDILRFFHATGMFVNYGYGATETTATVSCFKTDKYSFDYCGSVMPEVEVKTGDNNEILVKGKTVFHGYFNKPDETAKVLKDGWYYTGDEGYINDEGYLMMTDRIKDMMKTSVGRYVSPQKLELLLSQDSYIEQVVVVGDDKKYVSALIVPSFEKLEMKMQEMGFPPVDRLKLIKEENVLSFYRNNIDLLQQELSPHEKIIKFTLLPEPFTIENSVLTNTLKIKRKIISEKYRDIIDAMYR